MGVCTLLGLTLADRWAGTNEQIKIIAERDSCSEENSTHWGSTLWGGKRFCKEDGTQNLLLGADT